jgi:hypothetical protein
MQGDLLAVRMREVLSKGSHGITTLSPRVLRGQALWQQWHHDFATAQMPPAAAADEAVLAAAAAMDSDLEVIPVRAASQRLTVCNQRRLMITCSDEASLILDGCSPASEQRTARTANLASQCAILRRGSISGNYVNTGGPLLLPIVTPIQQLPTEESKKEK